MSGVINHMIITQAVACAVSSSCLEPWQGVVKSPQSLGRRRFNGRDIFTGREPLIARESRSIKLFCSLNFPALSWRLGDSQSPTLLPFKQAPTLMRRRLVPTPPTLNKEDLQEVCMKCVCQLTDGWGPIR